MQKWYLIDDLMAKEIDHKRLHTEEAYTLMYMSDELEDEFLVSTPTEETKDESTNYTSEEETEKFMSTVEDGEKEEKKGEQESANKISKPAKRNVKITERIIPTRERW